MKPIDKLIYQADQILEGRGEIYEDWRDAIEIYKRAAEMESGKANCRLGCMYLFGEYGKVDIDKAVHYYKQSVRLNYIPASGFLAYCYNLEGNKELSLKMWQHYFGNSSDDRYDGYVFLFANFIIFAHDLNITLTLDSYFLANSEDIINFLRNMREREMGALNREIHRTLEDFKEGRIKKLPSSLDKKIEKHDRVLEYWKSVFSFLSAAVGVQAEAAEKREKMNVFDVGYWRQS